MKFPRLKNIFYVVLLFIVVVGLVEFGLRYWLSPVDYLIPSKAKRGFLSVLPFSSGHDAWGFRNPLIPENSEIVTLGDKVTYGMTVSRKNSWPAQLAKKMNANVYNAGMPSASLPEYYCLMRNYAISLEPKWVVIGIFMANDIWESYRHRDISCSVKGIDYKDQSSARFSVSNPMPWLSANSLIYQALKFNLVSWVEENILSLVSSKSKDKKWVRLDGPDVMERFPRNTVMGVDETNLEVKKGVGWTKEFMLKIEALCREHAINCLYLMIPTKESVFRNHLNLIKGEDKEILRKVFDEEAKLREELIKFGKNRDLFVLDLLPALQRSVIVDKKTRLFRPYQVRPHVGGLKAIADAVYQVISNSESYKSHE